MKKYILVFLVVVTSQLFAKNTGFIFFGDWGTGTKDQSRMALKMGEYCSRNQCDFATLLGDNFYPSGVADVGDPLWEAYFEKPYKGLQFPFYAALGNHDYGGDIQAQIEYTDVSSRWKMPSPYYKFVEGDATFFAIDTEKFDTKQQEWLKKNISAVKTTWTIVFGHHPIFSHGEHGETKKLKTTLLPIIDKHADFYLSGHDHDLEVIEHATLTPTFIVSGAAAQTRSISEGNGTLYAASRLGFGHLYLTASEATYTIVGENGLELFSRNRRR